MLLIFCVVLFSLQIINVLVIMPALHTHSEMSHCGLPHVYIKELAQTRFEVRRNISTEICSTGLSLDLEIHRT